MGLRSWQEKTLIAHMDEGFVFLGMRIQRHKKRGAAKTLRLHLSLASRVGGSEGQGA
jgi:hypothetical protein